MHSFYDRRSILTQSCHGRDKTESDKTEYGLYVRRYIALLELFLLVLMKIGVSLSSISFEPSYMCQIH